MDKKSEYIIEFEQTNFIETEYIKDISNRSLAYLRSGLAVNFCGPTGTGKTSLALHVAKLLGRPVVLLHGNDELRGINILGGERGYRLRKKVDNFVHNVYVLEEDLEYRWVEGRLTKACRNGYTLVYDEFTRSRPELNNFLLSVLEEGILSLPGLTKDSPYLRVHPDFRIIFTSNPQEYAGVHKLQIALQDRLVTLEMEKLDRETEVSVVTAKTGLSFEEAEFIVDLVHSFRDHFSLQNKVSIRTSLRIAQVISKNKISSHEPMFRSILIDMFLSDIHHLSSEEKTRVKQEIYENLNKIKT